MDPKNKSHAFSISSDVLQGLTSLIFSLSFLLGVTNKRVLLLSICSHVDTSVQMCDMHGS